MSKSLCLVVVEIVLGTVRVDPLATPLQLSNVVNSLPDPSKTPQSGISTTTMTPTTPTLVADG